MIKSIRRAFIAPPGYQIVKFDQSAVEFRILLCFADEGPAITDILAGRDPHWSTVAAWKKVPYEAALVLPDGKQLRDIAKTNNYGVAYGQTVEGFIDWCEGMGIPTTREGANEIFEAILNTKPATLSWLTQQRILVKAYGYAETYFGRRAYYPELLNTETPWYIKQKHVREGVNSIIQGTAADIMKVAARRIWDSIHSESLDAKTILAVHDEMVYVCRNDHVEQLISVVDREAPAVVQWKLPLSVETGVGNSWGSIE